MLLAVILGEAKNPGWTRETLRSAQGDICNVSR
jgi:hypothetical protein